MNAICDVVDDVLSNLVEAVVNSVATTPQKLSRKRKVKEKRWTMPKRKAAHQAGASYISKRNKLVPAKAIKDKKDCKTSCRFKCSSKIDEGTRQSIFEEFYKRDHNGKRSFINSTTAQAPVKRKYTKDEETMKPKSSKRKNSIQYFCIVQKKEVKVCKSYYLSTLAVSQKMVYNVHNSKDPETGSLPAVRMGMHRNHAAISDVRRQSVIDHIESLPKVEAHYCRAESKRQFLEPGLNIETLYEKYVEVCHVKNVDTVKVSFYRYIFNTEYNLAFHVPKKDRCGRCEEHKVKKKEGIHVDAEEEKRQQIHL